VGSLKQEEESENQEENRIKSLIGVQSISGTDLYIIRV
jgi:hypothetical protein